VKLQRPSVALLFLLPRFWWQLPRPHPRPHLRRSQEVQDRSSAPLVRKQFPDCEPVLPSSCLFPYLCPHCLLLRFPFVAVFKQMLPRLRLVLTPPTLCRVRILRPLQVLACAAVLRLELMEPPCQSLQSSCYHVVLVHVSGIWYFFPLTLFLDHFHASSHFFSEISLFKSAKDLGGGIGRLPYLSL